MQYKTLAKRPFSNTKMTYLRNAEHRSTHKLLEGFREHQSQREHVHVHTKNIDWSLNLLSALSQRLEPGCGGLLNILHNKRSTKSHLELMEKH